MVWEDSGVLDDDKVSFILMHSGAEALILLIWKYVYSFLIGKNI